MSNRENGVIAVRLKTAFRRFLCLPRRPFRSPQHTLQGCQKGVIFCTSSKSSPPHPFLVLEDSIGERRSVSNMGKGGHAAAPPGFVDSVESYKRQPTSTIPFTIKDLRQAIPQHCFERSVLRSSSYLACDLITAGILFWGSSFIGDLPVAAGFLLWPVYWFCQVTSPMGLSNSVVARDWPRSTV